MQCLVVKMLGFCQLNCTLATIFSMGIGNTCCHMNSFICGVNSKLSLLLNFDPAKAEIFEVKDIRGHIENEHFM